MAHIAFLLTEFARNRLSVEWRSPFDDFI